MQQPGGVPPGYGGPTTPEERTWAMMGHIGQVIAGIIAPLVVYLAKRDSTFCRHHGAQGLNFAITQFVYTIINIVLFFLVIGFFTFLAQFIAMVVLVIMAGTAANRGEYYRYPAFMAWPMIS